MKASGTPVSRVEGVAKVTGTARYAAEFHPAEMAYAALAESAIAVGSITSLDTAAAQRAAGVILVLTHENAERLPYRQAEERPAVDPVAGEQLHVLQTNEVKFSGQPIAVVVAETQAQAEYAASLVRAVYSADSTSRTQFDPALARPTSEAAAKKGRGSESIQGDPEGAFSRAAVKIEQSYLQAREQHNAMEPHATVARWEGENLTVWSKTQWVGNERDEIARQWGIASEAVRVINPYVGGAFGSALRCWPHVTLAVMAARRADRPVRLELTRRQLSYSVGFRGQTEQRMALGADREGRLQALMQEVVGQTSTYEEFAEPMLGPAGVTYACPNRRTRYRLVEMNVNTPCPMRGPGWAAGLIAQEIAMDELAAVVGIDPIELRLRNFAERDPKKDSPWSSNRLRDCYRLGADRFGWSRRASRPRDMREGRQLTGMGMATAIYPASRYPTAASATQFADGHAVVRCATTDMGPGTYTSVTQIAADALGLPIGHVRFELGDSELPKAKEHGGSTTLASVGSAVLAACVKLKSKLDDLAQQYRLDGGEISRLLQRAGVARVDADGESAPGAETKKYSMHGFGAVFAEVSVDPDFGTVRVVRVIGAYDGGKIVNPKIAHSQCIGGMVGGIGMALLERVEWDSVLGRVVNANFAEYLVPVCADVHELDAIFVPGEDSVMNPLGVKGVAELGLCGVAPAIANAIWHATGLRMRDLPITPDKLLLAESNQEHGQ